jgi:lysosomal Pro-X carboxypeptidase
MMCHFICILHSRDKYGVSQRRGWIEQQYGGIEGLKASSNIILSNGGMDPWSSGGVLKSVSDTVVAFWIPEGAHHLDLFFSHPDDPLSVRRVRAAEVALIKEWVSQGKDGGAADQGKTSFVNQ